MATPLGGLSPAAREAFEKRFAPRLDALRREIEQEVLFVLVWGPAKSKSPIYAKRLQIRYALRQANHDAFFSEDAELRARKSPNESEKTFEYRQALAADAIIVLMASPGAIAEVHDFADNRDIASKMKIYYPVEASGGYSAQGALADLQAIFNNVETFTADDITSCRLKAQAVGLMERLRATKYRAKKNAQSWGWSVS